MPLHLKLKMTAFAIRSNFKLVTFLGAALLIMSENPKDYSILRKKKKIHKTPNCIDLGCEGSFVQKSLFHQDALGSQGLSKILVRNAGPKD